MKLNRLEKFVKEASRRVLSRAYEGDQEGYLYAESKIWLKYDYILTDDHIEAIKSVQRRKTSLTDIKAEEI